MKSRRKGVLRVKVFVTCTEHVFRDRVVIVYQFALGICNYGHLGLVQVFRAGIVQILPLAPSNNRALGADR